MNPNLRQRLTFGPIMLGGLLAILLLDHLVERRTGVKGAGVLLILLPVVPLATLELARLFTAKNARPFRVIAAVGGVALVVHAFCTQFDDFKPIAASTLAFLVAAVPLASALRKVFLRQTQEAILSMAGTLLATLYLGGLAWFLMAIRVKVGGEGPVRSNPLFLARPCTSWPSSCA